MPCDRQYRIIAKRNGPNDYSFDLQDINGGPANLVFNKSTDKIPKRDYYVLKFHLRNEPGCKLNFSDNPFSACAEKDGVNGCAPEGSNFLPVVFLDPGHNPTKSLVQVINTDTDVEKFLFGFSFVSDDGTEKPYYDPGGDNQNGGLRFEWGYMLVGAISGAIAAIGTATLVASQLEPENAMVYGIGGAVVGFIVGVVAGRH